MNYTIVDGARKDAKLYLHNSYLYTVHRSSTAVISLRCRYYSKPEGLLQPCKARAKIDRTTDVLQINGVHTCSPNATESQLLKMKTTLKRKAEVSPSSLRDIFDEVSNECGGCQPTVLPAS